MSANKAADSSFTFLPQGAIIQEFRVAGQNLVLGFPTEAAYAKSNPAYYGETIGRVANRISGAKLKSLNGQSYSLTANNGPNTLHGGPKGWGKRTFDGPKPVNRNGKEGVEFKYLSKDGEEGFPGDVQLTVWYVAGKEHDDGIEKTALEIEYEVTLLDSSSVSETVVNVTNHSAFTVSDSPTIAGTEATLYTNLHQVTDDADIPTGEITSFPNLSAGKAFVLGEKEPKIDHCFIVEPDAKSVPLDTRGQELKKLCSFFHPNTKLHFEALSTEPAFQFYTGEYIDTPAVEGPGGKKGIGNDAGRGVDESVPARGARAGFCVEASRYIDAPNREEWKGMVLLKKGQTWGSRTVYRGWKDGN